MKPGSERYCNDCGQAFIAGPWQRRCESCKAAVKPQKDLYGFRPETIAKQQEAVRMRIDGLTYREIARAMGVTGEWVRQLLAGTEADGVYWVEHEIRLRAALESRGQELVEFLKHEGKKRTARFRCQPCGHTWEVLPRLQNVGPCPSCGHGHRKEDRMAETDERWIGRVFTDWTVVARAGTVKKLCRCRCGVERVVSDTNLRKGNSKGCRACGLKRREQKRAQGLAYNRPRKA